MCSFLLYPMGKSLFTQGFRVTFRTIFFVHILNFPSSSYTSFTIFSCNPVIHYEIVYEERSPILRLTRQHNIMESPVKYTETVLMFYFFSNLCAYCILFLQLLVHWIHDKNHVLRFSSIIRHVQNILVWILVEKETQQCGVTCGINQPIRRHKEIDLQILQHCSTVCGSNKN